MSIPFVDLNAQYQSIKSEVDHAIASVFETTSFIGGEPVRKFEEDFAQYLGANHCVSCANGTDAIEIALKALGVGPGDEVIVPALTWISTAGAVNNVGAAPVFVDVLADERTIDPSLIVPKITDKTRAILPVHLYGLPARMKEIKAIAVKHKLRIIEDCAQAHGAEIDGHKVGTMGDIATFSFYPSKNLGAYGDAGAIVTNDSELAERCKKLSNHGQLVKHDHQIIGRNSGLDAIQAAVLNVKLSYLDEWTKTRGCIASQYDSLLKEVLTPLVPGG
ncbi:MAG: DegT/DnrJ/EryC1/StrS family aminotransferase, partial [Bacteroidota bacterium]